MRTRSLVAPAAIGLVAALAATAAVAAADPSAQSSAKTVKSTVKVTGFDATSIKGKIGSKVKTCKKGRFASAVRVSDGAILGTDRTTKKGRFRIKDVPIAPGDSYLVGVGKKTVTKFRSGKKPRRIVCGQRKSKPFAV